MTVLSYEIQSAWPGRGDTPAEIGAKVLSTLDALSAIDPLLTQWGYFDENNIPEGESFDSIRPRIAEFVAGHVWLDEYDEPEPTKGYAIWASNRYEPCRLADGQSAGIYVNAGSLGPNSTNFSVGREGMTTDPRLLTYPLFRSVLLALVEIWRPQWVNVRCSASGLLPAAASGDPTFPYSGFQMPWMAYLCAERADGVPIPADIPTERTPDGGLLMVAATSPLEPGDPSQMAISKEIARILIARAAAL
jgi:hypothetical protein